MTNFKRVIQAPVVCALIALSLQGCANAQADAHRSRPSPVCEAIVAGKMERATKLVEQGADVNADRGCALIAAAARDELKLVQLLLDHGANPNRIVSGDAAEIMGSSAPLVAAVQSRDTQMVRLLLERGADPRDNFEAFEIVLNFSNVEMAELLLCHGANANMTQRRQRNVYASVEVTPNNWQQVIVPPRDLEPDRIDETAKRFQCSMGDSSESLLYLAAGGSGGPGGVGGPEAHSLDRIVELLLAHGADPNARTTNGSTPLMFAASQHNHGVMTLLIDAGADVKATDRCGHTALDYADQYPRNRRAPLSPQTKALLQERQRT